MTRLLCVAVLLFASSTTIAQEPPAAEANAAAVEKLAEQGRQALLNNDIESAARIYREMLRLQPDSLTALYQLAIYHFRKKDYIRGFELINKAVEISPESLYSRLVLARGLEEVGKYKEAIEQYDQILALGEPGSGPAQTAKQKRDLIRFRLAARDKERGKILSIGKQLTNDYPTDRAVLDLVANIFTQAGFLPEARDIYLVLALEHPGDPRIELDLGNVFELMRNVEMALTHYERAIEKARGTRFEPEALIKAEVLRGILALRAQQKEQAHQHFLSVLELAPNNVIANMNVGGYLHEGGDLEGAKAAYLRTIEQEPENPDAHYRLAIVYLDMGDPINAVHELDVVLNITPNSPVGQAAQRTIADLSQRFNVEAIRSTLANKQALPQRLKENPNDIEALNAMGDLMIRQKRIEEALKYFERAMEAAPDHGEAFFKAGLLYDETRQFEKAATTYEQALKLTDDETKIQPLKRRLLAAKGNFHLQQDETEKAEENFLQAYELAQTEDRDDPGRLFPLLWGLATVNARQGELEEAAKWYEEVITIIPNHMGARINVAFVYEQLEEEEKASAHYNAVRLSEDAPPQLKQRAEDRLDYIRRQTNGFSYSVGYSLGFDDNLNSSRSNKLFEYRSNLSASAVYNYKFRKGMKLSVNASPAYTIYHRAQFDFFNFTLSPSLLVDKWGYDWSIGMSRNTQSSVLRPERSSTTTDTFNMSAGWTDTDKVNYRIGLGYRGFGSAQNPFFDANTVNLGINASFAASQNTFLSYGYSLTVNNNKNSLGNDYAYTGHGINGRIDKRLRERMTGYLSGNLGVNLYKNPDSSTNFRKRRRIFILGFGGGINYRLESWVSLFVNYNFATQHSNLPVGLIFSELQAVEGRQSTSLGSFVRNSISTGFRMSF